MTLPKSQSVWLVKWIRMLLALCAGLLLMHSLTQAQQAIPALTAHVIDHSATLDAAQLAQLVPLAQLVLPV